MSGFFNTGRSLRVRLAEIRLLAVNTSPERHTTLARLALPLLLNSILGLVTTLIDTMIISAHSKEAAAAVSLANQILVAAYDFSVLLGVGATVMISHAIGRGSKDEARSIASIAIAANAVLGVFIALLLVALGPLLIDLVNVPSELQAETLTYIHVIAIAMPFNGFLMASVSCLRGFSFTRVILMLGPGLQHRRPSGGHASGRHGTAVEQAM